MLPQTGMLIWPIPLLAAFGILIITFGQILKHKKAKIGRSIGTSIIYVGGIALLISAGLTTYNLLDANRAATSAKQSSQVLSERISQSKGIPAAENAEENEQEPVDNTLPLVEIDRERYIGMLSIPALSLELPINNDWSDTKLKESPCRYAGDLSGSLVICAHNYKAHFGGISSLAYGDTVLITDALGEEHEYTVVTVTRLSETDIDGMVNSPYDLTLFTCPSIGAERVTVRCTKVSP